MYATVDAVAIAIVSPPPAVPLVDGAVSSDADADADADAAFPRCSVEVDESIRRRLATHVCARAVSMPC